MLYTIAGCFRKGNSQLDFIPVFIKEDAGICFLFFCKSN